MMSISEMRARYPKLKRYSDEELAQIRKEVYAFGSFFAKLAFLEQHGSKCHPVGVLAEKRIGEYDANICKYDNEQG
jgi:hypothetical protein